MKDGLAAYLFLGALVPSLCAQPGIGQNGVVNRASQIPPTLPGGAIARGALFTIYGVRLGSPGNTTVALRQGKNSTPIDLLEVQARQVQALMPKSAPLGAALLELTADGKRSKPFPIEVAAFNPGIFSRNAQGWGPGRIDNISRTGARSANSTSNPARPGRTRDTARYGPGRCEGSDGCSGRPAPQGWTAALHRSARRGRNHDRNPRQCPGRMFRSGVLDGVTHSRQQRGDRVHQLAKGDLRCGSGSGIVGGPNRCGGSFADTDEVCCVECLRLGVG